MTDSPAKREAEKATAMPPAPEKRSSMELADEPKPRKKRESVPVIVCRLEGGRFIPMIDEKSDWREFPSTGEARKWTKSGDPKIQEGEYFIFPVQDRFKLKFETVRKIVVES